MPTARGGPTYKELPPQNLEKPISLHGRGLQFVPTQKMSPPPNAETERGHLISALSHAVPRRVISPSPTPVFGSVLDFQQLTDELPFSSPSFTFSYSPSFSRPSFPLFNIQPFVNVI